MSETQKVSIEISTASLIKIIVAALLLVALYIIRDIILMLTMAMVLASAMDPLVEWLYRRAKFPRGLSVILVYLVFIGLIGFLIYFMTPPIVSEFGQLGGKLQDWRGQLSSRADAFSDVLNRFGFDQSLSTIAQSFTNFTADFFHKTLGVVGTFAQMIAVLAITFYLISSENGMKNFVKSITPYKHQAYVMHLTDKIQKKIGYWFLGQVVLSAFIFAFDFLGLTLLGVKFALALALLAGLMEIVPYLGPIISAIPAILVALTQSPTKALFTLILYFVVQHAEGYILVPKIMGRTVGANPLVVLLAVLMGFELAGIIGMLLAVPIVAALTVFVEDFREQKV